MKKHEIFFSIADIIAAVNEKHPHVLLPALNPTKSPSRPASGRSTGSSGTSLSTASTKSVPSESNKSTGDGAHDGTSSPTPALKAAAKGSSDDIHKFDLLCEKAFTNSFSHRFHFDHDDEEDDEDAPEDDDAVGPKELTEVGNFSVDEVDIADAMSIATAPLTTTSSVMAEEEIGSSLLLDDKEIPETPVVSAKVHAPNSKESIEEGLQRIKQLHHAVKEEIYKTLESRSNDYRNNGSSNNSVPATPHTAVSNYTDSIILSPIFATLAGYAAQNLENYIQALDLYANSTTLIDYKLLSQCILQFFIQSSSNKSNKAPPTTMPPVDPTATTTENPVNCPEIQFIISAYEKKSLFGMHAYRLLLEIVHTELKAQLGGQAIYLDSSLALGSFRKFAKSNNLVRNNHASTTR